MLESTSRLVRVCVLALAPAFDLVSADFGLAPPQLAPPQIQAKSKVDSAEGRVCKWPHCLPKCAPCQNGGKRVDTCYMHYIMPNSTCADYNPNSECILGSCICAVGYCATPDKNGKLECTKKICDVAVGTGSEHHPNPPAFVRSPYLTFWMRLAPNTSFPPPAWMAEHYQEYVKSIKVLPTILFSIGFIIAIVTGGILCCGCTGHHFVNGKSGGQKAPTRPSSSCLFLLGVIIIVTVTVATMLRMKNNAELVTLAEKTIAEVDRDASTVARQALRINTTVQSFFVDVGKFVAACTHGKNSIAKGIMRKVNMTKMIEDMLIEYQVMVSNYTHMTQPIPPQIEAAQDWVKTHDRDLSFAPNIPLVLLGTICLIILGEALITICVGTSSCARCVDCNLRVASVAFVLLIIAVATAIAAGSTISITVSHACMNPDVNTLAYAKYYGNSSTVDDVTKFYLTGDVVNPVVTMADMAKKYIVGLLNVYHNFQAGIDFVEGLCSQPDALNLTKVGEEAIFVLATAKGVLRARNIWPYYEKVVREGVCHDLIRSLTNMVLLQGLVGLILFPVCAIMTHRFLVRWSDWEEFVEDGGDDDSSKVLVMTDEESEEDE